MFTFTRGRMSRLTWLDILAVSLSLIPGPDASAQTGVEVRVRAFAGYADPRGDGVPDAAILSSPSNVVTYDDIDGSLVLGIGLELRNHGIPGAFRLSVTGTPGYEEVGRWGCASGVPCPSILIEIPTEMSTTSATGDLVGDIGIGLVTLHPIVGGGWVRHGYEWDPTPVGEFSLDPGSHVVHDFALHYGVGAAADLGRVSLEAEYGEHRLTGDGPRPDGIAMLTAGISLLIR